MMKGGVSFVKLVVDNTKPVEINFPVDPLVEIDKIKWTINQHPIDVDENDDNDAVYWKRDASGVTLVIRYPSMCWVYALIFLNIPMQVFLSWTLSCPYRATAYWQLANGSYWQTRQINISVLPIAV